jgi:hypothetical protein
LRVIYGKRAQHQLWVIGIPTLLADQQVKYPLLLDFLLQFGELIALPTPIAHGDRVLT